MRLGTVWFFSFILLKYVQSHNELEWELQHVSPPEQLLAAIRRENVTAFYTLLSKEYENRTVLEAPVDALGGETVLTYLIRRASAENSSIKWVAALVNNGINPTIPNTEMTTPFLAAVDVQDPLVSTFLIERLVDSIVTTAHRTAVVRHLSLSNAVGLTPMCRALETGQFQVVDLLLDLGVSGQCDGGLLLCCEPLVLAVRFADLGTLSRLLPNVTYYSEMVHRALNLALELRRDDVVRLLVRHLALNNGANETRPAGLWSLHGRVMTLFRTIETNVSPFIVGAMVDYEIKQHNPFLCSVSNDDGRSLLHHAIKYGYKCVVQRLMEFYMRATQRRQFGYQLCYADETDKFGRCPSATLLGSNQWSNISENRKVLGFLFSQRHPVSGENCLHQALRRKEVAIATFRSVGSRAVKIYGPEILDLAGLDASGADVLLRAIETAAPQGVVALLLTWLVEGSRTNRSYHKSLRRGLLVAAGAEGYLDDPFVEAKLHTDTMAAAAIVCPAALQAILLTSVVGTPSDEQAYRQILQVLPGPFLVTAESPLSNVITALLSPDSQIKGTQLATDLAGEHNWYRYTPEHFNYALDLVGSTDVILSSFKSLSLNSWGFKRLGYNRSPLHSADENINDTLHSWPHELLSKLQEWSLQLTRHMRSILGDSFYPIVGDERVTYTRNTTQGDKPIPYSSLVPPKRARIIIMLLRAPLGSTNFRIHIITIFLLAGSTVAIVCVCFCVWFLFRSGKPAVLYSAACVLDIIPRPQTSWCGAFVEGLRRSFLVPRRSVFPLSKNTLLGSVRTDSNCYYSLILLHLSGWMYHCCFLWYAVEMWIICCNPPAPMSQSETRSTTLHFVYSGPLRYMFPITLLIHTIIAKNTCPEQALWMRWILFGQFDVNSGLKAFNIATLSSFSSPHPSLIRRFYWLPGSQRAAIAYLRALQRLRVRAFLKYIPLRFNKAFKRFYGRTSALDLLSTRRWCSTPCCLTRPLKPPRLIRSQSTQSVHSYRTEPSFLFSGGRMVDGKVRPLKTLGSSGKDSRIDQRVSRYTVRRRQCWIGGSDGFKRRPGDSLGDRVEHQLLVASTTEFGLAKTTGYISQMILFYVSCGAAAQFPFWRCFGLPFRLLYFDVYNSRGKYKAYTNGQPIITVLRELAVFCALWQQLVQLGLPVLLAVCLTNVMRRTAVAVKQVFPLQMEHWFARARERSCTVMKTRESGTRAFLDAGNKCQIRNVTSFANGPIIAIKAYVDVRQTVFKQFAYIWEPVETGLNLFLLCWGLRIVAIFPSFYRGALGKLFFTSHYNALGSQLFLAFLWIQWLSVQALRANRASDIGWIQLQGFDLQQKNVEKDRNSKRVLFQAINFFKAHEFRFTLASAKLNVKFATAFFFFFAVVFFEFTMFIVRDT